MELKEIKDVVESLIFVSERPLPVSAIKSTLGKDLSGHDLEKIISEIGAEYEQRQGPIELKFIANGWQFCTKKHCGPWIKKLFREKTTLKLSNSALETLSIIAYKQPLSRSEAEEIRGVEVSGVLETLLERKLIKIVGRKETLGRPLLYGTTSEFLRHFGLTHISELPSLDEITPVEAAEGEAIETSGEQAILETLNQEENLQMPLEIVEERASEETITQEAVVNQEENKC